MRGRIERPVGSEQLGEEKRSAHQRRRIAERGDGDVDTGSGLDAGREIGRDDDGGDIAVAQLDAVHVHAEMIQHALDRLLGEGGVAERVARAAEAHDEPVADELTVAGASEDGDILDPSGEGRRRHQTQREKDGDQTRHPPPTLTEPSACTAPETVTPLSLFRTRTTSPIDPSCKAAPEVTIMRSPSA